MRPRASLLGGGRQGRGRRKASRGIAMVGVVLVLMALFVLCAPFLLTVRNADRASAQRVDRAHARIALDSGLRHARAHLGASHPAEDRTPYFDSLEELEVTNAFAEDFVDANDERGVMWDLDIEDLSGRIDVNSASPHVLGNLLGGAARLSSDMLESDDAFRVHSGAGFLGRGFVWIDRELIGYAKGGGTFSGLTRGLGTLLDEDGEEQGCGPSGSAAHALGALVLDQRMMAIPRWRTRAGSPERLATFDAIEQVAEALPYALAQELGEAFLPTLERAATVHGGVRAGEEWQRAVRVAGPIVGRPDFGCLLPLAETGFFNAGTTVRITDGRNTELGIVFQSNRKQIRLLEALVHTYDPEETVVRALARRPVNVNTASFEVLRALFLNLQLRSSSARITGAEADALVELVVASRPFTGFEDFLRRVVFPAAGLEELPEDAPVTPEILRELASRGSGRDAGSSGLAGFLDADDAVALYRNALNANDGTLAFSTMPFAFTSRDVYRVDLRSAVNAPSGVERARLSREQDELVVPQRDLLSVWTRQEDFDEEPRTSLHAPGWLSGPEATGRVDPVLTSAWPSRARAHLGRHDAREMQDPPPPEEADGAFTFASREEDGWVQLAPARADEEGRRRGRVVHFDDETRGLEGRYLPDGRLTYVPWDKHVRWSAAGGLLDPISLSLWIQPRNLQDGDRIFDLAGSYTDSDRVTLLVEENDLVLRVLDGTDDHPASEFEEVAEVRYAIGGAASGGGGLPLHTWSHIELAVSGDRPDQMRLLVDGRWPTSTPGLTRLAAPVGSDARALPVESTEGFPDRCTIRIGDELIEVAKDGDDAFRAAYETVGENAGFGGRLARDRYSEEDGASFGLNGKDTDYPAGASVQLYGYSLPIYSQVPSGGGRLDGLTGAFGVARATGVQKGGQVSDGENIELWLSNGGVRLIGKGLDGAGDDVEAIRLESPDPERDLDELMQAFSTGGGYAAIMSVDTEVTITSSVGPSETFDTDQYGVRLGGVEVIEYTGWTEDGLLLLGRRGDSLPELRQLATGDDEVTGRGAFAFNWTPFTFTDGREHRMTYQTFVIPISIPVTGTSGVSSFVQPQLGSSEFAQITHVGENAHLTEWVRYDDVVPGHLVRDSPYALEEARRVARGGTADDDETEINEMVASSAHGPSPAVISLLAPPRRISRAAPRRAQAGDAFWYPYIGEAEIEVEDYPVTRAVASAFQFRGVMGTYSHAHGDEGAEVLPVWKTVDTDETAGFPGRFDHVFLVDEDPSQPAHPAIVQHAHRPHDHRLDAYVEGAEPLSVEAVEESAAVLQAGFDTNAIYVALQSELPVPFAQSSLPSSGNFETRDLSRVSAFPSGERPRVVDALAFGGEVLAAAAQPAFGQPMAGVPSAVVDEIFFGPDHEEQLVVGGSGGFREGETRLELRDVVRTPSGDAADSSAAMSLPRGGGLLRIGDEILCYESRDPDAGTVDFPSNGRALLGTEEANHVAGAGIHLLESWRATTLVGPVGDGDALLPVFSTDEFPTEGTLLVEDELIHYTLRMPNAFAMPAASEIPGAMDGKGRGLFRGRYGTRAEAHPAGTPVILFPFRYWDRWEDRADAPELSYYQLTVDQPDAFWRRVFWSATDGGHGDVRLGVLQRTDRRVPWDADPEREPALSLLFRGDVEAGGHSIGTQSGRASWRAFVRYEAGAFDPELGMAHGWKTTPRLELFGVEYLGPGRVLRRVQR